MAGLVKMLAGARAARPLLRWVVAVLGYVVFRPPQEWVLLLVVGFGVALTLTVARIWEGQGQVRQMVGRAWQLAVRLARAVADRVRGDQDTPMPLYAPQAAYGQVPPGQPVYGHVGGLAVAYDHGALLSGIVAVLAAEGVPTDAAPALPAVIQLLTNLGIAARVGACATTAWGLAQAMRPAGMVRPYRGMPAGLLASVIRAVLTQDQVIPHMITIDTAEGLIADSANVLAALSVEPVGNGGGLAQWPIVAEIIDAAPLPVPYEPWGR